MFSSIYNEGLRYIKSGVDPNRLRHHLDKAILIIHAELDQMILKAKGKHELAQLAQSICDDQPLAEMLGEIFDIVGSYSHIEIIAGQNRGVSREYHEGTHWKGGLHSRSLITNHSDRTMRLQDTAVLITDQSIENPHDLLPIYEATVKRNKRSLVLIARSISEQALSVLLANNDPEKFQVMAVKTPGLDEADTSFGIEDLAILTGGIPIVTATGDQLSMVTPEHLGSCRRAWASTTSFGLVGGKGNPVELRKHVHQLRTRLVATEDSDTREKIKKRIGKLMGGSVTLYVGGSTELEVEFRKNLAQRTVRVMRGVIREGIVPGGGAALLACLPALQQHLDSSSDPDMQVAFRILMRMLEAPMRTIIVNAGYEAGSIIAQVKASPPRSGFDVNEGCIADVAHHGIFDVTTVQKVAVRAAITGASQALTIDVLVHHKKPEQSMQPR
jgi:chaperonin GroEL